MAKTPVFPGSTKTFLTNTDNTTDVDANYMDQRDGEIEAIEDALGAELVPNTSTPLSGHFKLYGGNLHLVHSGGNVGVGVPTGTAPAEKLHVKGTGDVVILIESTIAPILRFNDSGGPQDGKEADFYLDGGALIFRSWNEGHTAASYHMLITHTGNVGIGATDPQVKLDVADDSIRIRNSQTPSSTGQAGEIAWDSEYIYVCVGTDSWKRVALSSF